MIVQALWDAMTGVITWALGLLPTGPPPEFIETTSGALGMVITSVAGLSAWVPWAFALSCIGVSLALWLALVTLKAIRWLIGWLPTMGGS